MGIKEKNTLSFYAMSKQKPRLKIDGLFELHGKFYKQVASNMTRHKMLLEQIA